MPGDFDEQRRKIARAFLLSAAVVDDAPYYYGEPKQDRIVETPLRAGARVDDDSRAGRPSRVGLAADAITEAFSKVGLICGVVKQPQDGRVAVEAVQRADLVVIDWQLHHDDGKRALELLKEILKGDQGQRLRLIAVYTGESAISKIGERIRDEMRKNGRRFESRGSREFVTLSCGHCRIEIYAKSKTPLSPELGDRSVSEEALPGRLIDDFAGMTAGLLPSIALVALTAVRENAHRVLGTFDGKLDAAFLTHRACLPVPDDSEQHVVSQIASELGAIMEEEAGRERPSGMEAIKSWIERYKGSAGIVIGERQVAHGSVLDLLDRGVDVANVIRRSRAHTSLTGGFARDEDGDPRNLDLRLAWMTCFRAIDPPEKKLWLGTAVRRCTESGVTEFLLCVKPRCDCVRMTKQESFLFLPLIEAKQNTFQLVVRSNSDGPTYRRVSVGTDMSGWAMIEFDPGEAESIVADEESSGHIFEDVGGNRYEWIGELKAEVAHSVGQTLASTLLRIALDKSEWLRRMENRG